MSLTHNELTEKAARWLKKHTQNMLVPNCNIRLTEAKSLTPTGEIPDVIGWSSNMSVLLEIKTSRSDFLQDQKKPFRQNPEMGVGNRRLYVCPAGLISAEELPVGWGLLWYSEGKFEIKVPPGYLPSNLETERAILLKYIRSKK